jgi:diacylglycerol kinase (ATP)
VPVAVLPAGNENVFARALGFDAEPAALARALAAGRTRRIDLGVARTSAGSRRFALMLSAGFDAEVVHRLARWRAAGGAPRRVRRAHYVLPTGAALWAYPHPPVTLTTEAGGATGVYCAVSNLPEYAMGLSLTPEAQPDDGLLDWVAFERRGLPALAGYTWAVLRARHGRLPHVRSGRARRLTLAGNVPVPVQVDGEPAGFTPAEVEALPGALSVVVV